MFNLFLGMLEFLVMQSKISPLIEQSSWTESTTTFSRAANICLLQSVRLCTTIGESVRIAFNIIAEKVTVIRARFPNLFIGNLERLV